MKTQFFITLLLIFTLLTLGNAYEILENQNDNCDKKQIIQQVRYNLEFQNNEKAQQIINILENQILNDKLGKSLDINKIIELVKKLTDLLNKLGITIQDVLDMVQGLFTSIGLNKDTEPQGYQCWESIDQNIIYILDQLSNAVQKFIDGKIVPATLAFNNALKRYNKKIKPNCKEGGFQQLGEFLSNGIDSLTGEISQGGLNNLWWGSIDLFNYLQEIFDMGKQKQFEAIGFNIGNILNLIVVGPQW